MPDPPWKLQTGLAAAIATWRSGPIGKSVVSERVLPAEAGQYAPFPPSVSPELRAVLAARGIDTLYRHQVNAIEAASAGRHVVIATPTASGKSLCFHLPVLSALQNDPTATALYLYPTKALSRDQENGVRSLIREGQLGLGATVYDGDTPGDARKSARQSAAVVMTNPDMLHAGILPQHARWARLFQNLRYVVVDEMHTYRGVFGSHVAHVLGRLRRVAQFHGSDPVVICATATIGNPVAHAARLLSCEPDTITLVDETTAPRGERRVMVYNPPVVNAELGIRQSCIKSAVKFAADLIAARVRTLVFGQSRNAVEIMLKYLRDRFDDPTIKNAIVAYRGGYLPDTRRRIESGLRDGQLLGVVATNALELGIDIGDLDAVVCAGYPGSLAGSWQRFGRAGRRGEPSLAVLVSSSAPLDQYLAHHPELLFEGAIEEARVDPGNTEIVVQHLKCAAFEMPFERQEPYGALGSDDTEAALTYLESHGVVHGGEDRFYWAADAFPANHVSLRSIGWDNYVIIDVETGDALAELDWHSTPSMLHEQAIYQHDGTQYQVERLDYENHKAFVRRVVPDYFTTALRNRKVSVIEVAADRPVRPMIGWGDVSIVEKVVGYKKVKFHTHENAGYGDVRLPDIQMHTTSFWLTLDDVVVERMGRARAIEGLRGLASALELVATLALMCDPRDIGRAIEDADGSSSHEGGASGGEAFAATAYLFDNVPCGVGLAERIYERADALLQRAGELVRGCSCDQGCPSCVGATTLSVESPQNGLTKQGNGPLIARKAATEALCVALEILPPRKKPKRDSGIFQLVQTTRA